MKIKKTLVLLCALLALCLLVSCAQTEAPADAQQTADPIPSEAPVEAAPEPTPEPAPEPITLTADYTITYEPSDGGFYEEAANNLSAAIAESTGAELKVAESADGLVITVASDPELGARDYAFTAADGALAITGGAEYATYQAVNTFIEAYVSDKTEVTVPGDLTETVPYEADTTLGSLDEIRSTLADVNGRVMIAAHRGAHTDYPDNTVPAVEKAVEMGADLVEVDIQRTKDDQLILCHDNSLSRYTDCADYVGTPGYPDTDVITDWTLEQLSVLKVDGTEYGIPALKDILPIVKGQAMLLLDKVISGDDMSLAQEIYELAFRCGAVDSLMYQHDSRFTMPDSFFDSIYAQTGFPTAHHIYTSKSDFMKSFTESYTPKDTQIQSLQVSFTENDAYTNPDYILPMAANTRLFANTLNKQLPLTKDNITTWQTLCDAGFSMIQSDDPVNAIAFARSYVKGAALAPAA